MIRAEARAAMSRWREALAGLALSVLGLWAALGSFGLLAWLGWAAVAAGAALVFAGIQRGRFRGRQGGPGLVEVVEGRIAYFGPLDGGAVALSEIEELRFDPSAAPPVWVLVQPDRPPLAIPVNAEGADQLFDIFATLPGLRTGHLLAELEKGGRWPVVIWEHPSRQANRPRLH